jgi:hypothetical protein
MSKPKRQQIIVTQNPEEEPVPASVLAEAIVEISSAMSALSRSRLKRDAIVALIKDRSGISKKTIEIVMNNLEDLERNWCKPRAGRAA